MKMVKDEFVKLLVEKAIENNIKISNEQAKKMYEYKELLIDWNERINLTAITEDEDIIIKHFVDSLLCVEHIKYGEKIIDVGTGAGFPGIVLAIYFKGNVEITLLDSLNKRIMFLEDVIKRLNLKNVEAVHGRAEETAHNKEYREVYDIAIARAVAPLNILLEYLAGYVKKDGRCICMKSISVQDELINSKEAMEILNLSIELNDIKKIRHREQEFTRQILILEKNKKISDKYPRSYGKIKKTPL